jgi:nucleoside-diphosphate-sugar epimerase
VETPSWETYVDFYRQYVLVTGATGFIGAHVVDQLLSRGIRVRGTTRSLAKGEAMLKARTQYVGRLDFIQIKDFDELNGEDQPNIFEEAVKGFDGIIHTASVRLLRSPSPFSKLNVNPLNRSP